MKLELFLLFEILSVSQAQTLFNFFEKFHNNSSTTCFQDLDFLNQERVEGAKWADEGEYLWKIIWKIEKCLDFSACLMVKNSQSY
jgi:hypothetical protein